MATDTTVTSAAADKSMQPQARNGGLAIVVFVVTVLVGLAMNTKSTMSPVWYGPFLSAAANLQLGEPLRMDLSDVKHFAELSVSERESYKFRTSDDVTPTMFDVGLGYLVAFATAVFPFLGDQLAIEVFQVVVHALSCTIIVLLLPARWERIMFLVLYAWNPVFIHYATFPFYYFWQAIPGFCIVFLLLVDRSWPKGEWRPGPVGYVLMSLYAVLLAFAVLARPTIVLAIIVLGVVVVRVLGVGRAVGLAAIFLLIVFAVREPSQRKPWHTVYIGVGAYSNPFGMTHLSDDFGYEGFERITGTKYSVSLGGNGYDPAIRKWYLEVLHDEFRSMLSEHPGLYIRNAVLNVLQSYSIGHVNRAPQWVHYFVAVTGAVFIVLLLLTRQFALFFAIGLMSGTFTPYYPPVQAYMYGSFVLIVYGAVVALDRLGVVHRIESALRRLPDHSFFRST